MMVAITKAVVRHLSKIKMGSSFRWNDGMNI
jgi:hypothetical protein